MLNIRTKLTNMLDNMLGGVYVSQTDIINILTEASNELDKVTNELVQSLRYSLDIAEEYKAIAESNQAKIDELMLEYCPDEMTAEQLEEWAKHQQPSYFQIKEGK